MTDISFLRTGRFWIATGISLVATGLLFAWELGALKTMGLSGPPRFSPGMRDVVTSISIALLFSLNIGLISWRQRYGSCPAGTKSVAGAAGALGAFALLCPACIVLPIGIAGTSLSIAFLAPFVPLFQLIALILLVISFVLLLPKHE